MVCFCKTRLFELHSKDLQNILRQILHLIKYSDFSLEYNKMIHSIFLINSSGEILLEKHWNFVVSRSVCDYYLEVQRKSPTDIPPVIATPHYYLLSIRRCGVHFVAVCKEEIPPLLVIEFLHRAVDIFEDFFSDCTETIINKNNVIIYKLLDAMLDNGYPLTTDSKILKELIQIAPPNTIKSIISTVVEKSKALSSSNRSIDTRADVHTNLFSRRKY